MGAYEKEVSYLAAGFSFPYMFNNFFFPPREEVVRFGAWFGIFRDGIIGELTFQSGDREGRCSFRLDMRNVCVENQIFNFLPPGSGG